jgi:hypothetical protein
MTASAWACAVGELSGLSCRKPCVVGVLEQSKDDDETTRDKSEVLSGLVGVVAVV